MDIEGQLVNYYKIPISQKYFKNCNCDILFIRL